MYLTGKEVAERLRVTQARVYIAVTGGTVGVKNGYAKRAQSEA